MKGVDYKRGGGWLGIGTLTITSPKRGWDEGWVQVQDKQKFLGRLKWY